MSTEQQLVNQLGTNTPNAEFGYPVSALVFVIGNKDNAVHLIFDDQATPSTNFANAPNGSIFVPFTTTSGEYKIFVKFGAKGGSSGAWAGAPVAFTAI